MKRLSADWQNVYGHTIVLAETFINYHRFSGACYRAAGWLELGQTRGFGRNAGRYFEHGLPKTILIEPLHQDVPQLLSSPFLSPILSPKAVVDLNQLDIYGTHGLFTYLAELSDSRIARGIRYSHLSILAIGICAWCPARRVSAKWLSWLDSFPNRC